MSAIREVALEKEVGELQAEVERLRSSIASYQAAAHNYVNEHAEVARLRGALRPLIHHHCGLCVPVDDQGRMGEVTEESCVCDADQRRARAALQGGGK